MKKFLTTLTIATFVMALVSCQDRDTDVIEEPRVPVLDMALNQPFATLAMGGSLTLTTTIIPEQATNRTVFWHSTNPSVATVANGNITALSAGFTNIVAITEDGNKRDTSAIMVHFIEETDSWDTEVLGMASFATNRIWVVGSQVWSDAVQTDFCSNKTTFDGGIAYGMNAESRIDCRSNPNRNGDLFTWLAVYELREKLCPHPWRVPTMQEFRTLDTALGGTGWAQDNPPHRNLYFAWGAEFNGFSRADGTFDGTGVYYWSQSNISIGLGSAFTIFRDGMVLAFPHFPTAYGISLRCVRDN